MIAFFRSIAGHAFAMLVLGMIASVLLTIGIALHLMRDLRGFFLLFVFLIALSFWVSTYFTKPLRHLAAAARRLGGDIDSEPMREEGPSEVRDAAVAFNGMQARIRRDMRERTSMLAAITHDLQTPLTRMRLRLEKVDDESLRAKLLEDLRAMREMIDEGLDLARSLDSQEALQRVDLDSLLASVCEDAQDAGQDATFEGSTGTTVLCSPTALRRCITNLVNNAVLYGGYARVLGTATGADAVVSVRDGGPGIPADKLDSVFEPFFRLEGSRSRETGGTGLGLTIARNIARRYGGEIALSRPPEGGLEATLTLPAAPTP